MTTSFVIFKRNRLKISILKSLFDRTVYFGDEMFLKWKYPYVGRRSIVLGKEKTRLLFDLSVTRGSFLSADTVF